MNKKTIITILLALVAVAGQVRYNKLSFGQTVSFKGKCHE